MSSKLLSKVRILLILVVLGVIGAGAFSLIKYQSSQLEPISFDEFAKACIADEANQSHLLRVLNMEDASKVSAAISYSTKHSDKLDAKQVYRAIWGRDDNAFPQIDIDFLSQPIIKLSIAISMSKIDPQNSADYVEYVRLQLRSESGEVRRPAIQIIAHIGNETDIDTLREVAINRNGEHLSAIAESMLAINRQIAVEVLNDLIDHFGTESEEGQLITDITSSYSNEAHKCGHH